MLTLILGLLGSRAGRVGLVVAATAVALAVVVGWSYRQGRLTCQAKYEALAVVQRLKEDEANEKSRAELENLLSQARRGSEQITGQIAVNDMEAASDADADRCGLSHSGVVRHNRLVPTAAP